jgi:hypothetical protein
MPTDVQRLYQMVVGMLADKDQDGVPDLFEGATSTPPTNVVQTMQFIVDGKVYTSLDELPAEARQKYEQTMARFDANRDGIPDMIAGDAFGGMPSSPTTPPSASPYQPPEVQVIGESGSLNMKWLLIGGAILLLVAVAAIWLTSR